MKETEQLTSKPKVSDRFNLNYWNDLSDAARLYIANGLAEQVWVLEAERDRLCTENAEFLSAIAREAETTQRLRAALERSNRLLHRYRTETPLGHQPHMIAHEVDVALRGAASAVELQPNG